MSIRNLLFASVVMILLAGCGGGSGAGTSSNPQTSAPEVSNYTGPAPATSDVQAFKLNVWDNLVPNNRCGTCHNDTQSPRFVRADDINLAYDIANALVDLSDPGSSLLVTKVRGGHNCWLSDDDACGDIIQSYVESWAGDALGGSGNTVTLTAPPIIDPGTSKNFPADSSLFASTVYPLLTTYCAGCHTETASVPQSPFFAGANVDAAYEAAQSRIDLETPANSRFVLRLGQEFHNCWSDCSANAAEMQTAITNMSDAITPTSVDPALVTSKALTLTDGIASSSGGRVDTNVIAFYEFKTGSGNTVFDTSGVEPALNLTLSGNYQWVGGWGVQFIDGKAQGSTTASTKLRDLITSTGEFSVEAWVAPANVVQDGPSRIVSYAGSGTNRNFMLGQTQYNYDTFVRQANTDAGGNPQLSTDSDDEDLQATLQHVVLTYDPVNGRQIYVNGRFTDDVDGTPGGNLNDWDDTYAFALASEVDNDNRWAGTVRLLAVHNRVLSADQVQRNYDAGVGERYFLLFNVSDHVNVADAYVVFEVSQFDSYSYLFDAPFFTVLSPDAAPGDIPLEGLRIGSNGRELPVGQAFANLNVQIDDAAYTAAAGQLTLSTLGTVVPLEKGAALDEFFLTFERLGSSTNVVVEAAPVAPPPPPDQTRDPALGVRDFAEINAAMSKVTGIPTSNGEVAATYALVRQAMPVDTAIGGFASSQQMGVTQLAIKYCSVLVDDPAARSAYFPGFDFNAGIGTAFSDRSLVVDPLMTNMVGSGLIDQPSQADLSSEVNALIDRLVACGGSCEADRTERVVKASCAAVLGSAVMMVQ